MFTTSKRHDRGESGNALFILLIAIVILGALSYAVSQSSDAPTSMADNAARDEQIARMFTYAGTIAGTLNQMVATGARADTLYSNLSVLAPSNAAFNTGTHNYKLYHPMGGGLNYVTASGSTTNSDTVATSYLVNPGSIVTDIGPTDVTVGDILFTAKINSLVSCQRINYLLRGSTTVPVLATASFDSLFTTGSTVTINATNCASCVAVAQSCVSNTANTAWGYYAALFPG